LVVGDIVTEAIAEQMLRQNGFTVKNLSSGYRIYNAMKKDQ
jgi:biotin operon repressor